MKGWMKYKHKGNIYNRLRPDQLLYFSLNDDCQLVGTKDEDGTESIKPEVSFEIRDAAITINQENTNQFEVVGNSYHLVFTVESAQEALSWMSHLQLQRSVKQGVSPAPSLIRKSNIQTSRKKIDGMTEIISLHPSESESVNGELVFDDPLSVPTFSAGDNPDFEWDNQQVSPCESARLSSQEETSAVFQLSKELSSARSEIDKYRQRLQSYQEVLSSRDKQLFEVRDKISSQNFSQVNIEDYKSLELQIRSYKEQNALLNEEILKLHQMNNKSANEARNEKRRANKLAGELQKYQRDYLAALGCCVYRPLVDPDDGAFFDMPDQDRHIANLKALTKNMRSNNDRILGCSIPTLGKTEHVDAFSFVHGLPNEALQVQYTCNHLQEAYDILIESDEDNQKSMKKWKKCIMDNGENFEITPQLRKLVLQGVPSQYRAYLWQKLILYYVSEIRERCGDSYYETIIAQQESLKNDKSLSKYLKQITMDVPRTMPNNKDYTAPDSTHRERLQNVLRAFCKHSVIGYCQGFNFLAGGCLVFLEEDDAFWFLIAVVEKIFPPGYYNNGLSGLLADQYVLQHIISIELPKLIEHLAKFPDVDLAAVTTGWFLGLFFDCLPFQTLIRVWDCFLSYGHEAVYRISFAMFKIFESRLLELNELSQILHGTKNIPKLCVNPSQLIKEAFSCTFPPWEEIEQMRSQYEAELIEKHQKKMVERRYYDQRMLLLDEDQDAFGNHSEDKYVFNCGAAGEKIFLSASCRVTRSSQLYQVEGDLIRPLKLPITDRVTCIYVISDDIILLGLFSGQLQAYSLSENALCWSMSLSDVVLCIISYDVMVCVGTADGKLHFLQISDVESERICSKKPTLLDSIDLGKKATTCCCHVAERSCLWVASGPAIYVVNVETNETDGFILISSRIEFVSAMLHWSSYVLISVRGSSVIQLHNTHTENSSPLLVYDVDRQVILPSVYPMMHDDKDAKSPSRSRITTMVLISEGVFWVGTAGGDITIYMFDLLNSQANLLPDTEENTESKSETSSADCSSNAINIRRLRNQHVCDKAIRSLVKTQNQVVSCTGFYGEEGAVKLWNFEGDFTVVESGMSASSSCEVLEESKSLASSSRSLDADSRVQRQEGSSETWKTIKSATAAAVKSSKPRFRKLMNMWGS